VNYRLLSLIEDPPEGFCHTPVLSQEDVGLCPFALLAEDIEEGQAALIPFGTELVGIIVVCGTELIWQQVAPLLFHFSVPHALRTQLAPLLHSHLMLLHNGQKTQDRICVLSQELSRAQEEGERNKCEFVQAKETLIDELAQRRRAEEELLVPKEVLRDQNDKLLAVDAELRVQVDKNIVSQDFLKILLDAIPIPVFHKDTEYRYTGINHAFEQFYATSREKMVGKSVFDIAPPELAEIYHVKDRELMQNPGIQTYEAQAKNMRGEVRDIVFHKATFNDAFGNLGGMVGTILDITERKAYELERLKMEKLESLGVLAGGIAHDFNNILSAIMGNITLAQRFFDPAQKGYKYLTEVEKASARAAELALQLLTFARGGEPVKKILSPRQIVCEAVDLVLHGSNVKGVVDIPDSIDAIEADAGQMSQVLHNIVINAAQSMPGGGTLTITATNEIMSANNSFSLVPGTYVRLMVTDQGCGIKKEVLQRIFDPYFTTKTSGNGLGLASVHSIIGKHQGQISVSTLVGTGTTFTILLPSIGESFAECSTELVKPGGADQIGGLILVLDDEEMIRKMTREMLEAMGFEVVTCANGTDAVKHYALARESGAPFSAAIMDLTIPGGLGGKAAAQQILDLDPNACLIVSSGYSNDPIMSDFTTYGFCAAIGKPYKALELEQLLGSVLTKCGGTA